MQYLLLMQSLHLALHVFLSLQFYILPKSLAVTVPLSLTHSSDLHDTVLTL